MIKTLRWKSVLNAREMVSVNSLVIGLGVIVAISLLTRQFGSNDLSQNNFIQRTALDKNTATSLSNLDLLRSIQSERSSIIDEQIQFIKSEISKAQNFLSTTPFGKFQKRTKEILGNRNPATIRGPNSFFLIRPNSLIPSQIQNQSIVDQFITPNFAKIDLLRTKKDELLSV